MRLSSLLLAAVLMPLSAQSQVDLRSRSILFVRGADGTGGLGSGSTEHLSDIDNVTTGGGNHGFGNLAASLRDDGFSVSQWIESSGTLTLALLEAHRVVVFGSNNRSYSPAEVAAFSAFMDAGGSALFMSDANWGPNWDAASASDNQLLAPFGLQVYQDSGFTPQLDRSDPGRYPNPEHPVLSGAGGVGGTDDVNVFEGEGVSFFALGTPPAGWTATPLATASGFLVRSTTGNGSQGSRIPATATDFALIALTRGPSTIVGHFDRNTFFNPGGVGSSLPRFDNEQLALNLFRMLASVPSTSTQVGTGCGAAGRTPTLDASAPDVASSLDWVLTGAAPSATTALLLGFGPASPTAVPGSACTLIPASSPLLPIGMPSTDFAGASALSLAVPDTPELSGLVFTGQAATLLVGGPALGVAEFSSGVEVVVGYPR